MVLDESVSTKNAAELPVAMYVFRGVQNNLEWYEVQISPEEGKGGYTGFKSHGTLETLAVEVATKKLPQGTISTLAAPYAAPDYDHTRYPLTVPEFNTFMGAFWAARR